MKKLSTKNLGLLPKGKEFQNICKSISALEAIICPEWEYRYFSYDKNWSESEEICEIRNGLGDQLLILFSNTGIVINGFTHGSQMNGWKHILINEPSSFLKRLFNLKKIETKLVQEMWKGMTEGLPQEFEEFIFGEPVKSTGTTFCIWQKPFGSNWEMGKVEYPNDEYFDGSTEYLSLLDGSPNTFKKWAEEYYLEQFEKSGLDLATVQQIYNQHKITLQMVEKINPELKYFHQLKSDLEEIGYENDL